jgi:hypothetical protein
MACACQLSFITIIPQDRIRLISRLPATLLMIDQIIFKVDTFSNGFMVVKVGADRRQALKFKDSGFMIASKKGAIHVTQEIIAGLCSSPAHDKCRHYRRHG